MNLLQFLKENEEARRVFGKRELKIIEKQLQGISLTQSEKNRLSRDIRKKFKFIKDVARFENEFELKKAQIVKDLINEAKEEILHHSLKNKIKKTKAMPKTIPIPISFSPISPKSITSVVSDSLMCSPRPYCSLFCVSLLTMFVFVLNFF